MNPLAASRRIGLLWLPVLLVLLARTAVAPGWMLEQRADGSISVRICSDPDRVGQTVEIAIDRGSDHEADVQQHCGWGALAAAPLLPTAPISLPFASALPGPIIVLAKLGFARASPAPRPPAQVRHPFR